MEGRGLDQAREGTMPQARHPGRKPDQALHLLSPGAARGCGQGVARVGVEEIVRDTKSAPRIKDPALLKLIKMEADECEISGVTNGIHLHHVVYRSHGGDDLRCNLVCLSEEIHTQYHAGNPWARGLLGRHIDANRPDVACYIAEKLGGAEALLEWFSRHAIEVS